MKSNMSSSSKGCESESTRLFAMALIEMRSIENGLSEFELARISESWAGFLGSGSSHF
jgi:hypothetical protein